MKLLSTVVCVLISSVVSALAEPNRGGYDCVSLVPQIIAATKANRALTVELITIEQVTTTMEQADRIECSGLGIWTNTSRGPIRFFAHEEFGKWLAEYHSG